MKKYLWIELVTGVSGYALLFSVSWKVGLGALLILWSNNLRGDK